MPLSFRMNQITGKPANPQDAEVLEIQREIGNSNFGDESSELSQIVLALKALYGVSVQILSRTEEASSLSASEFLIVSQLVATQNTIYTSSVSTLNGKCKGIMIGGTGNVTIYHYSPIYSPNGRIRIGVFPLGGSNLSIPFKLNVAPNSYFGVSTDTSSNGVVTLSAWIEPISLTGKDLYMINNTPGQ